MTIYNEIEDYKSTEFYNVAPTGYFSIYDMRINKRCLCFKVTDNSYLNLETKEYIELKDYDLDMMVEIVQATVEWRYINKNESYKEEKL